jgi:hypothetical protein
VRNSLPKGFALLIKAPTAIREFVRLKGKTIKALDKDGNLVWSAEDVQNYIWLE